jgi:hypothetical protein
MRKNPIIDRELKQLMRDVLGCYQNNSSDQVMKFDLLSKFHELINKICHLQDEQHKLGTVQKGVSASKRLYAKGVEKFSYNHNSSISYLTTIFSKLGVDKAFLNNVLKKYPGHIFSKLGVETVFLKNVLKKYPGHKAIEKYNLFADKIIDLDLITSLREWAEGKKIQGKKITYSAKFPLCDRTQQSEKLAEVGAPELFDVDDLFHEVPDDANVRALALFRDLVTSIKYGMPEGDSKNHFGVRVVFSVTDKKSKTRQMFVDRPTHLGGDPTKTVTAFNQISRQKMVLESLDAKLAKLFNCDSDVFTSTKNKGRIKSITHHSEPGWGLLMDRVGFARFVGISMYKITEAVVDKCFYVDFSQRSCCSSCVLVVHNAVKRFHEEAVKHYSAMCELEKHMQAVGLLQLDESLQVEKKRIISTLYDVFARQKEIVTTTQDKSKKGVVTKTEKGECLDKSYRKSALARLDKDLSAIFKGDNDDIWMTSSLKKIEGFLKGLSFDGLVSEVDWDVLSFYDDVYDTRDRLLVKLNVSREGIDKILKQRDPEYDKLGGLQKEYIAAHLIRECFFRRDEDLDTWSKEAEKRELNDQDGDLINEMLAKDGKYDELKKGSLCYSQKGMIPCLGDPREAREGAGTSIVGRQYRLSDLVEAASPVSAGVVSPRRRSPVAASGNASGAFKSPVKTEMGTLGFTPDQAVKAALSARVAAAEPKKISF